MQIKCFISVENYSFPHIKVYENRRICSENAHLAPLWPETVAAPLDVRPEEEESDLEPKPSI